MKALSKMGSGHFSKGCIETNLNLPELANNYDIIVVFADFCVCRDLFFFEEKAAVVQNKKHYFP